jgi:hypothetical protein
MIYTDLKYQSETPLDCQFLKMQDRRENKSFPEVGTSGRGDYKERGNEDVYGGCVLCPYIK